MPKVCLVPGTAGTYKYYCPACIKWHLVQTKPEGYDHPIWGFNGDVEKPTFTPSVYVTNHSPYNTQICHSFVTDGSIEFLNDCSHDLRGKTVSMINLNANGNIC